MVGLNKNNGGGDGNYHARSQRNRVFGQIAADAELTGASSAFSTTVFNLGSEWLNEINGGLMVRILIDTENTDGWFGVSLDYSELTLRDVPAVPVPAAVWLFGTALLGLAGFSRRKKKV